jgi:hypothetical protein
MFCRSLFVFLYFFFCSLCCLFLFDIRILITSLWYLRYTDSDYLPLVSSNSSYASKGCQYYGESGQDTNTKLFFFSDNTRVRIFFLSRELEYFFSNIGNQNIYLEKKHNPPFKLNGRSLSCFAVY